MNTIDNIMDCFPYPTVTPIIGQPGYENISEMHLQLNVNSASVQAHIGNGTLWKFIPRSQASHIQHSKRQTALPPPNPRQDPINPTVSTSPQIADIRDAHARKIRM